MWTWIIIGGIILAIITLVALSGRTDRSDKWPTGGSGMSGP
jgi:hypothetical protein